jgi:hypothetical protein
MLSTDQPEFWEQLATLCAGFNIPVTTERKEAYWTGLRKMNLVQFVRVVEYALSEDGPDKFPTTKAIWNLHKAARAQATQVTQPVRQIEQQDHLLYLANRMFLRHLVNRGGLGSTGRFVPGYGMVDCQASPELLAARKVVMDLVDWFCGPIREGDLDATPSAFITAYIAGLQRVSPIDRRTLDRWKIMLAHPRAQIPFPAHMGRELPIERQFVPKIA